MENLHLDSFRGPQLHVLWYIWTNIQTGSFPFVKIFLFTEPYAAKVNEKKTKLLEH